MTHMKRCTFLVLAILLIVPVLYAQTAAPSEHDEIALSRAKIQSERQEIVATALKLPEEKSKAFWPLYREYRAEIDKQGDRVWKLMYDFSEKYESLSDADASVLLKEWMSIEQKHSDIRAKWVGKFSKAIGAASTARFFQIESKLDSIIRLEATESIPLAEPAK